MHFYIDIIYQAFIFKKIHYVFITLNVSHNYSFSDLKAIKSYVVCVIYMSTFDLMYLLLTRHIILLLIWFIRKIVLYT